MGHKIYGGARRMERMEDLKEMGIVPICMDVTKEEDNKKAVERIIKEEGRIDVLINNAGFGLYGTVEDIPMEDARYQFDVNLFGLANLSQLVLPHMRKQGTGRIVNISSMGGKIYTPLGAWYHASKHAVEGFSDCLRIETKSFGIDVVVIEPGAIETDFGKVMGESFVKNAESSAYKSLYDPYIKMMEDQNNGNGNSSFSATKPEVLAKVIAEAATVKNPKTRYVAGAMAKQMMFIRKWFGDRFYDRTIARAFT
jgi:short-subunit dehydrogenase